MSDSPENLILEHLRAIRAELNVLKEGQADMRADILSIRKYLHNIQGDALRREQTIAVMQVDIDRIKTRLDLSDA